MHLQNSLLLGFLIMILSSANGDAADWKADPDVVKKRSEQRPEFNYDEAQVPDYQVPDPLLSRAGGRIESPGQWPAHRAYLLDLFSSLVYGRSPGPPDGLRFEQLERDPAAMEGKATLKRIAVISEVAEREHRFELILFLPNGHTAPAPAFLLLNNRDPENTDLTRDHPSGFWPAEEVIERGYAIAAIQVKELAPDNPDEFRNGMIRLFEEEQEERAADAPGGLTAWAWGAHRVMDYFEAEEGVDATRVAVVGHSRGGKASLWAGAQDERFAIAISNESGCGGAALSRRRFGETVARINRNFPHWFCENFNDYNDNEDALPVDQHMLIALMAPRAVYVASADEDLWADPRGEFLSLAHASPVFSLWGQAPITPDMMPPLDSPRRFGPRGYHIRRGGHNLTPYDWHNYMDFADHIFGSSQ